MKYWRRFIFIVIITILAGFIVLPKKMEIPLNRLGRDQTISLVRPNINFNLFGKQFQKDFELKQGLDIQGGTQIVLQADMTQLPEEDRDVALASAREVILRRVDLFGVSEPVVQTSKSAYDYRIIVELAGVDDPQQALQLIGTTAELDFRLQGEMTPEATLSAMGFLSSFQETGLTGADLKRSSVQFDPQTGQPQVGMEFNEEGTKKFAEITQGNRGKALGIFLDGYPVMTPTINDPILTGQASITGQFSVEDAKQLSIQLNAGALPVPIVPIEVRAVGASLGQESVQQSVRAGLVGIGLVMLFMILVYGWKGVIADIALIIYAIITVALYKLLSITVTLPGIAGLLLSVGMAVDANILIFERIKEELRVGKPFETALQLGFGRAWDSIKDANITTILTALILINPLNFQFLNSSGLVRGFGVTLLLGVLVSLFTGVIVTRTFMRLFLKEYSLKSE